MNNDYITQNSTIFLTAQQEHQGQRIDKFITSQLTQYSRSFLQKLFNQNKIIVNSSKSAKPSLALKVGDSICILFDQQKPEETSKNIPDNLGITIIAKEKDFLIINKPAGIVVHPPNTTFQDIALTDWLTKHHQEISHVGLIDRPGIVHRLDKDTSGLMIIARTNHAHDQFTQMFKNRKIHKTYLALVSGHPDKEGTIDYFIGRHPAVRHKMTHFTSITKQASSRNATTHYKTIEYYDEFSLIQAQPITGRTHQIRVHFAAIGHAIIADPLYGKGSKLIDRHALHAHKLEFEYQGQSYSFISPLEPDLQKIVNFSKRVK